jgi:hypothetical protein
MSFNLNQYYNISSKLKNSFNKWQQNYKINQQNINLLEVFFHNLTQNIKMKMPKRSSDGWQNVLMVNVWLNGNKKINLLNLRSWLRFISK